MALNKVMKRCVRITAVPRMSVEVCLQYFHRKNKGISFVQQLSITFHALRFCKSNVYLSQFEQYGSQWLALTRS